jgi:hypothetical protein
MTSVIGEARCCIRMFRRFKRQYHIHHLVTLKRHWKITALGWPPVIERLHVLCWPLKLFRKLTCHARAHAHTHTHTQNIGGNNILSNNTRAYPSSKWVWTWPLVLINAPEYRQIIISLNVNIPVELIIFYPSQLSAPLKSTVISLSWQHEYWHVYAGSLCNYSQKGGTQTYKSDLEISSCGWRNL